MPFRTLLDQYRQSIEREVFVALGQLNEYYRTLPDQQREISANRIVGLVFAAFDDPRSEVVYQSVLKLVEMRYEQGVSLRESLMIVAIPRRAICGVLAKVCPDRAFRDEIEQLTQTLEGLSATIVETYEKKMSLAMTERATAERRYRLLYDRTPIMMHSIDAEGRLIEINEKWEQVLGYSREEVLGRKSVEFMTEASRHTAITVNIPQMLAAGYIHDVHYQFIKKNGQILDVLISAMVVRKDDGQIERILGVLLDVTDRLKAERALQDSEEQYRSIVERSPLGICIHRAGTIIYANSAMRKLVGVDDADALRDKDLLTFTHPDFHETTIEQITSIVSNPETSTTIESKLLRSNDEPVEVEVFQQQIVYEGLPATQFVYLDISARKRAEEALSRAAASESMLAAQDEMIRALSCPLIPFGKGALLMPLIGTINQGRATRIIEELARGVVEQQASIAIVDVTGVPEVDSDVADALLRAASVVRLLGADVMLTGIQPGIAKVIVELGIDMSGFAVKSSLQQGLTQLMGNREWRNNNQRARG